MLKKGHIYGLMTVEPHWSATFTVTHHKNNVHKGNVCEVEKWHAQMLKCPCVNFACLVFS